MKKIVGAGDFQIPCAGTSYRQGAIAAVVGRHDGSYLVQMRPGELSPDPTNEHDANALKVMVGQQHIGWVPKEHAAIVKSRLAAAGWGGGGVEVDLVILNGQQLAGKTYSFFAELDIPREGPIKLASGGSSGGEPRTFAKWSKLIPAKSGAFRCVTFVEHVDVAGMSLGDTIEPWSAPHWGNVNYYRNESNIGLGVKILQISKEEHWQAFGDKSTTGTLVDVEGRFYTFELAADAEQIELAPESPGQAAVALPHGIAIEDGRYTWGGCYFRTLEQATEYAERHKGLPPPAPRSSPASQPAKPFKWWLWGPVGLVVAIFAVGVANGPKTYADVAEMEYRSCMRSSGDGHWRASSGVTLETFCRSAGNIEARREFCKAHPESC